MVDEAINHMQCFCLFGGVYKVYNKNRLVAWNLSHKTGLIVQSKVIKHLFSHIVERIQNKTRSVAFVGVLLPYNVSSNYSAYENKLCLKLFV